MTLQDRASTIARAIRSATRIAPLSSGDSSLSIADAYAIADDVRAQLGGRPVGRKVGFTNRAIWPVYGVDQPIWGVVMAEGLLQSGAELAVDRFAEPRIEPEIVLGLGRAPEAGMDIDALADCVDWIAPAFEIVQSIYPGWSFALADTIAAQGLHGALVLGDRMAATRDRLAALPDVAVRLHRNGAEVETGAGRNALGGPLDVLAHLVQLLDAGHALQDGELVATGTLTDAWPVLPGQSWNVDFRGAIAATVAARFT